MAYTAPMVPTTTMVIHMPWSVVTFNSLEISKIASMFKAPVYKTIGSRVNTNDRINSSATNVRVSPSKRFSKNSGIVVNPIFKYRGAKYRAAMTKARAEVTSQATMMAPFRYDEPFMPTKCSVEILVNNKDPAITIPVKDL